MYHCARTQTFVLVGLASMLIAAPAMSSPTLVVDQDLPSCDPLAVAPVVEELGVGFPPDELITAVDTFTNQSPCTTSPDNIAVPNALVSMTNLTPYDFIDVHYVADLETTMSNVDGLINFADAFRIDTVGVHRPLVFESSLPNNIFESGETWQFIIQDYTNALGLPASALDSIGVPSPAVPPIFNSSGSIIATLVPEPASIALLGLGGLMIARKRRVT